MYAHRVKVTVSQNHEVVVHLPADFPQGEAEVIIVTTTPAMNSRDDFAARLEQWIASLPAAPVVPLGGVDRGDGL